MYRGPPYREVFLPGGVGLANRGACSVVNHVSNEINMESLRNSCSNEFKLLLINLRIAAKYSNNHLTHGSNS